MTGMYSYSANVWVLIRCLTDFCYKYALFFYLTEYMSRLLSLELRINFYYSFLLIETSIITSGKNVLFLW